MKKIHLLLLLVFLFPVLTHAQCAGVTACTAAGVDSTSVQNALNSINTNNTTLTIPSGSATWTSRVTYSSAFSIVIQGSSTVAGTCAPGGTCTATDSTIITDALTGRPSGCGSGDGSVFQITTTLGKSVRVTGLTFRYSGNATCLGSIVVGGTGQATRFDHNHFNGSTFVAIGWTGWTYGVVDHNLFDVASGTWNAVKFEENNYVDPGSGLPDNLNVGDGSWADSTFFGTTNAVYVENNNFNWGPTGVNNGSGYADDCTSGGRFVFRFNVLTNAMLQTHPTGGGQRHRGCRTEEVYQNTYNGTNGAQNDFNAFWLSSGSALVWGNTVNGNGYTEFVTVHSMRRNNNTYTQATTPSGWGYCGTSFNGTGSNWDQNTNTSSGRKCIDRPGMGKGDRLINDFPNVTNNATGCTPASSCAYPREQLEPVYEWLNNASGVTFFWNVADGELLANEDYYNYTSSGFTGASGVGSGTLSAMPGSCTNNPDAAGIGGTAYWATDQGSWNQSGNGAGNGVLYHCVGGVFTPYYTPLTYPHPLVQSVGWTWIQDDPLVFCTGHGSVSSCSATIGNIAPTTPGSVWVLYMQTTNHVTISSVCNGVGCTGTNNGWVHCPNCNAYNPSGNGGTGLNVDAFYNLPPAGTDTRSAVYQNMNIVLSGVSGTVFGGGFLEVLPPPGTTVTYDDSNIATPTNCTSCTGPTLTNVTGTDAILGNPGGLNDTGWNETSAPYFTSSNGSPVGLNLTSGAPWTRQSPAASNPEFFEIAFKSSLGTFTPPSKQYSIVNFTAAAPGACSTCTFNLATPVATTGNLLYVQAYTGNGSTISTVTGTGWVVPSGGNTCNIVSAWGGNTNALSCAYNLSATAGTSSLTVHMSGSVATNFAVFEITSNTGGSFAFDAANTLNNPNAGGSYYEFGPSMTLTGSNDVILQSSVVGGGSLGPTNYPIPAIAKNSAAFIGPFNYFFLNQAAITILTDSGPVQTALGLGAQAPVANWINPQHNNIIATSMAFKISGGSTPTANAPTFTPGTGTYNSSQSVTIATTLGTILCWNTTGSPATNGLGTGCSNGTFINSSSGSITVSTNSTIFAVAGGSGFLDSTVASAAYTIKALSPSCSPGTGSYSSTVTVTCTNTNSAPTVICYTTDGTNPTTNGLGTGCTNGTAYSTTISISTATTLNVVAGKNGLTDSSIVSYVYSFVIATFTPTSVNMGQVPVGKSSNPSSPVTLQNTGTSSLVASSITLGASSPFSLVNNTCGSPATITNSIPGTGFTLTAGSSCTFQVVYSPTLAVPNSDFVSFTDNTTTSPDKVALSGVGTGPSAPGILFSSSIIITSGIL